MNSLLFNKSDCVSRGDVLAFLDAKVSACVPGSPEQFAFLSAIEYITCLRGVK